VWRVAEDGEWLRMDDGWADAVQKVGSCMLARLACERVSCQQQIAQCGGWCPACPPDAGCQSSAPLLPQPSSAQQGRGVKQSFISRAGLPAALQRYPQVLAGTPAPSGVRSTPGSPRAGWEPWLHPECCPWGAEPGWGRALGWLLPPL